MLEEKQAVPYHYYEPFYREHEFTKHGNLPSVDQFSKLTDLTACISFPESTSLVWPTKKTLWAPSQHTWLSCPGTSRCWCGKEAPWCRPRRDSPAGPASDSPWRPLTRPWRCSSLWPRGWGTATGWSLCRQHGHAAAQAFEAGRPLSSGTRKEGADEGE